ncbi:MAG TPA: DUF4129 domain-containing protein [Terriglobales bacterium]
MAASMLDLLSDGAELYRQSFRQAIGRYYLASAPFAVALLFSLRRASATRLLNAAPLALVLALLYAVRIVGVGGYERALLRQLGDATPPGSPLTEIWMHAVLLTLWLCALPLVLGTGLFFTAAQYAPLAPRKGLRAALRGASRGWVRQWVLLLLVLVIGAIIFINLAVTAVALPPLLHALFGIGGAVGLEGISSLLLGSGMFWLACLAGAYLALDPLVKCALVIAYHRAEAEYTGADLLARLAKLRARPIGGAVSAILLTAAILVLSPRTLAAQHAHTLQPQAMGQAIAAELRQPAYAWHAAANATPHGLLDRIMAAIMRPLTAALHWVVDIIRRFVDWLSKWLLGQPGAPRAHGPPGRTWQHAGWALAALCLLAAATLAYLRRRGREAAPETTISLPPLPRDLDDASPADRDEESWFALADRLRLEGDCRLALRAAFLGCLAGLAQRRLLSLRRDRTNREYYLEFMQRAALTGVAPERTAEFRDTIRAFDEVWYGGRSLDGADAARLVGDQRRWLHNV